MQRRAKRVGPRRDRDLVAVGKFIVQIAAKSRNLLFYTLQRYTWQAPLFIKNVVCILMLRCRGEHCSPAAHDGSRKSRGRTLCILHIWRVNATSVPRRQGINPPGNCKQMAAGVFPAAIWLYITVLLFWDAAIPRYAPPLNRSSANSSVTLHVIPSLGNRGHCLRGGRGGSRRRRLRVAVCLQP